MKEAVQTEKKIFEERLADLKEKAIFNVKLMAERGKNVF